MKTQTETLTLPLKSYKTYLWATAFVAGNILLPQLCHVVGFGGKALLPILFFTLIAAARFGIACGVITALASPLINNLLFGMPAAEMLAVISVKSLVLAVAIGLMTRNNARLTLVNAVTAILLYQSIGFGVFALLTGSAAAAWSDIVVSVPGMLVQILTVLVLALIPRTDK